MYMYAVLENKVPYAPVAILMIKRNKAPGAATNEIHFFKLNIPPSEVSVN